MRQTMGPAPERVAAESGAVITDTGPQPLTPSLSAGRARFALVAMAVASFILITAEFLPSGLLTLIADDLAITPGQAGQLVTATAVAGLLTAPLIGAVTPGIDRRSVMVWLAVAAAVSDIAVAVSPNIALMLISRFLIGAAISGFWSMSLAVVAQLSRGGDVARGMMIVNAGSTLATVLGVPLGIAASAILPWREVFVVIGVISFGVALALRFTLPAMPAAPAAGLRPLAEVLRRVGVPRALGGHVLVVFGHMAAYAFIRVILERVPGDDALIAVLLTAFGVGGFVGNLMIGLLATRFLRGLSLLVPLLMGVSIIALAAWPVMPLAIIAVVLWGASFGGWLVTINTWTARRLPDALEPAGSLVVVGFQLAIAMGAAIGGLIIDTLGVGVLGIGAGLVAMIGGLVFASAARH